MTTSPRTAWSAKQAYTFIRTQILNGSYAEGMRLTELQISDELGLSRTPVREAMRLLVADGFLHFQPNSGTFVRTWDAREIAAVCHARVLVESTRGARGEPHDAIPQHEAAQLAQCAHVDHSRSPALKNSAG